MRVTVGSAMMAWYLRTQRQLPNVVWPTMRRLADEQQAGVGSPTTSNEQQHDMESHRRRLADEQQETAASSAERRRLADEQHEAGGPAEQRRCKKRKLEPKVVTEIKRKAITMFNEAELYIDRLLIVRDDELFVKLRIEISDHIEQLLHRVRKISDECRAIEEDRWMWLPREVPAREIRAAIECAERAYRLMHLGRRYHDLNWGPFFIDAMGR